jgi:4-amino-4-deoxy-L-arabinose transferase-like glycosyltransferase
MNTLRRNYIIIIFVLIILLYINPLLLGFSHRYLSYLTESILILMIAISCIALLINLESKLSRLVVIVLIIVSTLPYYKVKRRIVHNSEIIFFDKRETKMRELANYILKSSANKNYDIKDIENNLISLNLEDYYRGSNYVAFKVATGIYNFDGFLYSERPPTPKSLFGNYITNYEEIEKNWYSFSTR